MFALLRWMNSLQKIIDKKGVEMDIILKVLQELSFVLEDVFKVEFVIDDGNEIGFDVNVMISSENVSQAFLLVNCENAVLHNFVDGELTKEIAVQFRKKEYHKAEMDRNTSLIFLCKCSGNDNVDVYSKVKIEDDPYYFKKYVLSYDEIGLQEAKDLLNQSQENNVVNIIQEYVTKTDKYAKYKKNSNSEPAYAFFVELVTKLHCFPMKTVDDNNIISINDLLKDQLDALKSREKNPIDIKNTVIEAFVAEEIDFENAIDVCTKWNTLLKEDEEKC